MVVGEKKKYRSLKLSSSFFGVVRIRRQQRHPVANNHTHFKTDYLYVHECYQAAHQIVKVLGSLCTVWLFTLGFINIHVTFALFTEEQL